MKKHEQLKAAVVGLVLSCTVIPVATADDIEIYTNNRSETTEVNPNILFLVDNSFSMRATSEVRDYYDPTHGYRNDGTDAGACKRDGIYFAELPIDGQDGKPDCTTNPTNYFNRSALVCDYSKYLYRADKVRDSPLIKLALNLFGFYSDQFARRDESQRNKYIWEGLPADITDAAQRDWLVECLADSGVHGSGKGSNHYIIDETGGNSTGYTSIVPASLKVPHPVWDDGAAHKVLWDGNYINYLNDAAVAMITPTRLEQVKRAVLIMASTNNRVNVGVMALDENAAFEGGAVQYPMEDIVATRNNLKSSVNGLDAAAATTLSEAYYEALLYFGGKNVDYGDDAAPGMNGSATLSGNVQYKSPISSVCGVNYIVVLSDGTPTNDDVNTNGRLAALPNMPTGVCNVTPTFFDPAVSTTENTKKFWDDNDFPGEDNPLGNCLDNLAEWAHTEDVATDAANPLHNGDQHILTHTIGFDLKVAAAEGETLSAAQQVKVDRNINAVALLKSTAEKGGGKPYIAKNGDELLDIFGDIISTALKVNTTFSSPAVSVNAFNRSTHLDDLYFTLFKPHATQNAWLGNLKKYKLKFDADDVPFIADGTGVNAVAADTGYFASGASSFWSTDVDGLKVEKGGAAAQLSNVRNVYTITGGIDDADLDGVYYPTEGTLAAVGNEVDSANADLTNTLLGIADTAAPVIEGIPYRTTLLDWAAGIDVFNKYGAVDSSGDARLNMGDPLHAEPALVQYKELTNVVGAAPELVAYVATNDGYLHAFDVKDGKELFSFIPQDLLPALPRVMGNSGGDKTYGLDGSVVAWVDDKPDLDGNWGIIGDAVGEKVILYFGMRRGGRNIYAVDVTVPLEPKFLWEIKGGFGDYAELGETWSTVNVGKIRDIGYPDEERAVLIFGGGYDATQDNATARRVDGVGRNVFIADAVTGERLWSARDHVTGLATDMQYSIPARVTVLDIRGDGFIDRIYASDMGGQIFRFDINNTSTGTGLLTTSIFGARIAELAGNAAEDTRRFYYPPDVALIDPPRGDSFHSLVTSSGFRAHPLNTTVHDRIYMLKDRFTGLLTANDQYKYVQGAVGDPYELGPITEAALKDVTLNLAGGDSATDADRDAELALIYAKQGWYIDLDNEDVPGTWIGEKGLAESLIIEGTAIVTTYTPAEPEADTCSPPEGIGKVFYLDIVDGTPEPPYKIAGDSDARSERHVTLHRGGIPPPPNFIITKDGRAGCIGTECQKTSDNVGVRKTYWYEVEK